MPSYKNGLFILLMGSLLIVAYPKPSFPANLTDLISHGKLKEDKLDFSDIEKWNEKRSSSLPSAQSEILKDILMLDSAAKTAASLEWLRNTIKNGEVSYIYPFMYAFQLYRTEYVGQNVVAKQTAAAMKYYATLLLLTDAARCDDKGAGTNELFSLSKQLAPIDEMIKSLSPKTKKTALDIALFLEAKFKDREKRPTICQSGIGYMNRAMANKNTQTTETIAKEGNTYGHIPGSKQIFVKPSDDTEVHFIPDEEWHEKRSKIREALQNSLSK